MSKISLSFYCIKFHPPRKTATFSDLDKLTGKEKDLFSFIEKYLSKIPVYDKSVKSNHEMFLESKITKNGRQLYGRVVVPNEGYASNIHDSNGKHQYARNKNDKEFIPFYFLIDIPHNSKTGIVVIQRQGQQSPKVALLDPITLLLHAAYTDYVLKTGPIHLGSLFLTEYLDKGKIKEVEAIKYISKSDKASQQSEAVKFNLTATPVKRGASFPNSLNKMLKLMNSKSQSPKDIVIKVSELFALNAGDYDSINFLIDLNGSKRRVDLGKIDNFATRFDITDKISLDKHGFPKISEIHQEALVILKDDIRGKLIND